MLSQVILFYYTFFGVGNGRWNNVNIVMTLTNLKYCFSGSLTITDFILLSLVILEYSCMLDTYLGEILNKIKKNIKQEQLMKYCTPTPTDIWLSPPKHLQFIGAQYTFYRHIFFTATAMQNCHGTRVLEFLMDYWTISNFMLKFPSTRKTQMFYLVLNYMGEYIHLLIKPVLNPRALSYLKILLQLTKTSLVTINHLKLIRSLKLNSCHFSQLCYTFTGHQLNAVYHVRLFTSIFCCLSATMAKNIGLYNWFRIFLGWLLTPSGIWRNYYAIYIRHDTKILCDLSLTQYYHTEESVRGFWQWYWFRRITCFVRSIHREQLWIEKKGNSHEEYSEEKLCFWHPALTRVFKNFQKIQELWNIWQS